MKVAVPTPELRLQVEGLLTGLPDIVQLVSPEARLIAALISVPGIASGGVNATGGAA